MRLIDADEYERELITVDCDEDTVYNAICVLDKMPTVDPVTHGHWNLEHCCSKCGRVALSYVRELREVLDYDCISNGGFEAVVSYYETDWCPHCGARMNEVSE